MSYKLYSEESFAVDSVALFPDLNFLCKIKINVLGTFLSRVIKLSMLDQLRKVLKENKKIQVHQSAYR